MQATEWWDHGNQLKYDRELAAELTRLEKAEGGGKKGEKKSGKKKSGKKSKKGSGKKGSKKGKAEVAEKAPPTAEELLAKEVELIDLAIKKYKIASNLFVRAVNMCIASKQKDEHPCYISCCLNAGEALLRVRPFTRIALPLPFSAWSRVWEVVFARSGVCVKGASGCGVWKCTTPHDPSHAHGSLSQHACETFQPSYRVAVWRCHSAPPTKTNTHET